MKTILVPTDFSECARHALNYAVAIAQKSKAQIMLLHIVQRLYRSASFPKTGKWMNDENTEEQVPYMMEFLKGVKRKMKSLISSVNTEGIKITDTIQTGNVSKAIKSASKKCKADLIVMGTHGTKGLNEVLIGSNASQVVRDAEIPVLTVNTEKQSKNIEIRNIVFATDFSEETNLVFPFIKYFAEIFGAKIHLLKIVSQPDLIEKAKEEARRFQEENNLNEYPVQILHNLESESEGIRRFASFINADLIALGTHGRHGLAHFFKGSIAENVVNHATHPVLTVNFHKKKLTKTSREIIHDRKTKPYESDLSYQIPTL